MRPPTVGRIHDHRNKFVLNNEYLEAWVELIGGYLLVLCSGTLEELENRPLGLGCSSVLVVVWTEFQICKIVPILTQNCF